MKNLPADLRSAYPDIPWTSIAGMRDKVIHDYMGVDYELVWAVATQMLGPLKGQVASILDELGSGSETA